MSHFDLITQGLTTKSDKIRALARQGVATADIARHLGIKYQHARNVLMAEGLHKAKSVESKGFAEAPQALYLAPQNRLPEWLRISPTGAVQLPSAFLAAAGVKSGDGLLVNVTSEGLELITHAAAIKRAQALVRKYVPEGVSLVDELIADRRREQQLEDERP